MKTQLPLLLAASAALACNSPDPVLRPVAIPADVVVSQALNQVVCLDPDLILDRGEYDPFLIIERHGSNRTQSGTLAAWATLASRSQDPLSLQVRSTFYDESGGPVEDSQSAWTRFPLAPLETKTFRTSSMSSRAAQYYVEVRLAR